MEIRQIHYFLSIARTGSFTAAADELFVSQSSLSKQIIALEHELGLQLFDRRKRKVTLTEAGRAFRTHAVKIDQAHTSMVADLEGYKPGAEPLSIAAIPVIAHYGIPRYIAAFREAHPAIRLTLEKREAVEIAPALSDHSYDLAFTRAHCLDRDRHAWMKVFPDRLIVVVSIDHRLASRPVVSLQDLRDQTFVVLDRYTAVDQIMEDVCRGAGFEPRTVHATQRSESIVAGVAANMGIGLMMERIFDYNKHPRVVALELVPVIETWLVLAHSKDRMLSGPARAFIEFVAGLLASQPEDGQ
jgi:LysR family transcriptional activator of glutamate synthase operon